MPPPDFAPLNPGYALVPTLCLAAGPTSYGAGRSAGL